MVADAAATARQNTGLQRAIEREKALGVELEQELRGLDVPALKQPTTVPAAPSAAPSEDAGQEAATDSRQAAPQSPTADIRWQTARCSWYGPGLYGTTTADGTTYTPRTWCVAHKSLPFGTMVELRYRGTTVVAPVRDRGPYVAGRTFDLSNAVAQALGFTGVQTVEWRVVAE
jgi:rare lipoprotein A